MSMPHLSANGVPVPFTPEVFTRLRDSTELWSAGPGALRRRLLAEGCVVVRDVLDRAAVLRLRAAYFGGPARGYLASGSDPAQGRGAGPLPPGLPPYGAAGHPTYRFVRSGGLRPLLAQPALRRLAAELLGGDVFLLPRQVMAHRCRGERGRGGAHIDRDSMARGSDRAVTFWIPLGDCPPDGGGLVYLEDSHTLRPAAYAALREPEGPAVPAPSGDAGRAAFPPATDTASGARSGPVAGARTVPLGHDLELTARRFGRRWRWREYHAGDVVAHLPRVVHAPLDTRTDRMRLSVEARYVRSGDRADERWLAPWRAGDAVGP